MKPTTPLPWTLLGSQKKTDISGFDVVGNVDIPCSSYVADRYDAAYIVHACNNFPRLVAALRETQQHLEARPTDTGLDVIRQRNAALLRELGEAE